MPRSGLPCVAEAQNGWDKWAQMGANGREARVHALGNLDENCQKPKASSHAEAAGQLSFRTLLILLPTQPLQSREDRRIPIKFLTECIDSGVAKDKLWSKNDASRTGEAECFERGYRAILSLVGLVRDWGVNKPIQARSVQEVHTVH
ncbi:hypothetical protein VC83_05687 [Pseudogymnoascus destructans]|uniref:Uncharacterized protein n=1 Tax=Pseudogymnoascus destructans TaxID=655981 RepID=A0A177A9G8_9PEZI|nr:uncharacterized protein VC83_05687 [Pseudogymnoascus destructans]OAF57813.1 hypothetical protein VC83_05687 [Pseudogymnoascus destructans]